MPIDALYEAIRNAPKQTGQQSSPAQSAQPQAASSFLQAAAAAHPTVQPEAPAPTAAPATPADLWNGYDYNAEAERRAQVGGYTPAPEAFRAQDPLITAFQHLSAQYPNSHNGWAQRYDTPQNVEGTDIPLDSERGRAIAELEQEKQTAQNAAQFFDPLKALSSGANAKTALMVGAPAVKGYNAANRVADNIAAEQERIGYYNDDEAYRNAKKAEQDVAGAYMRRAALDPTEAAYQLDELKRQKAETERIIASVSDTRTMDEGLAQYLGEMKKRTDAYEVQIRQLESDLAAVEQSRQLALYDKYLSEPDFAEKSQYVPSAKIKASDVDRLYGREDAYSSDALEYELVNGNAEAWAQQRQQILRSVDPEAKQSGGAVYMAEADETQVYPYMTAQERATYNYLYAGDPTHKEAKRYLELLTPELNSRFAAADAEMARNYAKDNPVLATLYGIASSTMKPAARMGQIASYASTGEVDQNAPYNRFSTLPNTMIAQAEHDVERKYGKAAAEMYKTAVTTAQNLYLAARTGGLTSGGSKAAQQAAEAVLLSIMSTGAAADGTIAAKSRGLSDKEAMRLGTANAAIEAATEEIGMDAFFDAVFSGKSALLGVFKSALAEGAEEGLGDFLNDAADIVIAGVDAERMRRARELKAQGYTDAQATSAAFTELLRDAGLDTLRGMAAGALMSGGANVVKTAINVAPQVIQDIRDAREQNRVDEMVRMANEEAAQRYAGRAQTATPSTAQNTPTTAPFAPQEGNDTAQTENATHGNTSRQTASPINVGRATTIKAPYTGDVPTQSEASATVPAVPDEAVARANARIEEARNTEGRGFKAALTDLYAKTFQRTSGAPVSGLYFKNKPYLVEIANTVPAKVISDPNLSPEKLALLDMLPEIVYNAEYVGSGEYAPSEGKKAKPVIRYDYFETPVTINGKEYIAKFDVAVLPGTNNYRTHQIVDIDLLSSGASLAGPAPAASSNGTGLRDVATSNVAQSQTVVNTPAVKSDPFVPAITQSQGSPAAPASNTVGAAETGYNYADMPREQKVSRQYYTTQTYSRPDTAEASGRTEEAYRKSLTYETRSIEEAQDRAAEALYYMQDGKETFVGQIDPDGLNDVMNDLAEAKAWNDVQTAQAQMILAELRREAAKEQTAEKRAQFNQWLDVVQKHVREGARGMRMNREFSYSRDANRDGIITEQAAIERVNSNDKLSDAEKQALTDEIMEYDERITDTDDKAELIDIIMEIAEERKTVSRGATGIVARTIRSALNTMSIETLKQAAYASSAMLSEDAQKVDFWRKVKTIQVLNMLSNPKTTVTNVTSNLGMLLLDVQSMRLASLFDMAVSARTKTRSLAFEKGLNALFTKEGRERFAEALIPSIAEIGLDINLGGGGKYFQGTQTFKADGRGFAGTNNAADKFTERVLHVLERNMNYALRAPDEAFKGLSRASSQSGLQRLQDERRIRTENENYAEDTARDLELYRTFQNQRLISDVIVKLHDVLNLITPANAIRKMTHQELKQAAFGLGDIAAPFAKIAANLVGVAVDYNPVTAVKGLVQTIDVLAKGETATAEQQRRAVSNLSRGLTGTALTIAAMFLARLGLIRRASDEDDKSVASLNRTEGMTGTQINLSAAKRGIAGGSIDWQQGDMLIDLSRFEPINFLVDLGATLVANDAADADFITRVGQAAKSELESFGNASGDLPVLQSVGNFVEDVTSYGTPWYKALADTAGKTAVSSLTPNVIAALAKGIDPYQRNLYTRDNYDPKTDTLIDALMATLGMLGDTTMSRIPGLREMLPTKTDTTGNAAPNPGTLTQRLLNAMILPWGVNTYAQTETSKELERLREATGRTDFYPRVRNTTKSVQQDKVTYTFDYEERQEFQRLYSEAYWKDVNALVKTARYKNMDDAQKADALKSISDDAYDTAKSVMIQRKKAS